MLGIGLAAAGPPATLDFPLQAEVACPEHGLCWIEVPPELLAAGPDHLFLVRRDGPPDDAYHGYPYAVLSERAAPSVLRFPRLSATSEPDVVSLTLPEDCVVERVSVEPGVGSYQAAAKVEARIRGQEGWQSGPWGLLSSGLVDEDEAELLPPEGPIEALRVRFDRPWSALPASISASLRCRDAGWVRPREVALTPGAWGPIGQGKSRYTFSLPSRARVVGLELEPEGDVFQRNVEVGTWEVVDGELRASPDGYTMIERIKVGDLAIDRTRVDDLDLDADRLVVDVWDGIDRPLSIPAARALLARRVLIVRDAGALTLYGGAPGSTPAYDLDLAVSELARQPFEWASVSSVEANPGGPQPQPASLAPGASIDPTRFLYEREVTGQGLVRLELPLSVLARARADLSDLRLLDEASRQIPYVIEWGGVDQAIDGVIVEPEEEGTTSRLRIKVPELPVLVSAITLHSPDDDFSRSVELRAASDLGPATLSAATWAIVSGQDASLTLRVDQRVEGPLLVEIDNGDNRLVHMDGATVHAPTAALVAYLPADGKVRLMYGDRADLQRDGASPMRRVRDNGWDGPLARPSYDAEALLGVMSAGRAQPATLGLEVNHEEVAASDSDRALASVAIGALVLSLIGLVGWLLRGVRTEERADPPASGGPTG